MLSVLHGSEQPVCESMQDVREAKETLDATPDRILGVLRGPDIRVAGEVVVSDVKGGRLGERDTGLGSLPEGIVGVPEQAPRTHSPSEAPPEGEINGLWRITIFCCRNDPGGAYCGNTASGVQVAPGLAACSVYWPFGTTFNILGSSPKRVVCLDRGSSVASTHHLDVFFYDCGNLQDPAPGTGWAWLQKVGTRVLVEVLE